MGLPLGRLADSTNRRNLISICIAFWSFFTAGCALARSYTTLFLARMGVGIGEAGLNPASFSILSDLFPKERLGAALSVFYIGQPAGIEPRADRRGNRRAGGDAPARNDSADSGNHGLLASDVSDSGIAGTAVRPAGLHREGADPQKPRADLGRRRPSSAWRKRSPRSVRAGNRSWGSRWASSSRPPATMDSTPGCRRISCASTAGPSARPDAPWDS